MTINFISDLKYSKKHMKVYLKTSKRLNFHLTADLLAILCQNLLFLFFNLNFSYNLNVIFISTGCSSCCNVNILFLVN